MADIFLSHAHEDETRIRDLVPALEGHGWSIFWDRDIPIGRTWQNYIGQALTDAKCVIVAWSHHSVTSEWVIEEANNAKKRGLLMPILLDPVDPPLGFGSIQAADLTDWKPGYSSPRFDQLTRDIAGVVGGKPRQPPPEEELAPPGASTQRAFTNSIGLSFVLIPAGSFTMGSPAGEPDRDNDERQHPVTISKPFYLQITEVTQKQWTQVMESNPSRFRDCGDDCPVEWVSWDDAREFIRKLNQKEGGRKYRLPSEAEWEYACRAGSAGRFCFGDDAAKLGEYAWYEANSGRKTHPVGRNKPNAWGLYDMHGNVFEWCQDWYGAYPTSKVTDPTGPKAGETRVLRGGSWYYGAWFLRSANRADGRPDSRGNGIGFRVVKDL